MSWNTNIKYPAGENDTSTIHAQPSRQISIPVFPELMPVVRISRPSFSQELRDLAHQFASRPARLSEILAATQGRGFNLFLLLIGRPPETGI